MRKDYTSVFAADIRDFVATKRATGRSYVTAEWHLRDFDRYCLSHADSKGLSRSLVLEWAKVKEGEMPRAHRSRISYVREFGKFLQSTGFQDAFVLPTGLSKKVERYVPHFFTAHEITSFFTLCDSLPEYTNYPVRHLVLPVFFRLLYCCGLRPGEARWLRVENVELKGGHIDIFNSKGCKDRRLPLPQDLLELLRVYDGRVSKIFPGRIYFFPQKRDNYCCSSTITRAFNRIWKSSGLGCGYGNKVRVYDFRHNFALENLNRWIASGIDVNVMLPYLSRYMGHASLESTDYYLHLVPEFFHTFAEKARSSESILPEVDYGE